jgi:hypothetical protein
MNFGEVPNPITSIDLGHGAELSLYWENLRSSLTVVDLEDLSLLLI